VPEFILTTVLMSAVLTALAVGLLRPWAGRIGLIDRPGGHKQHQGEVPVIGGLAMFLGFTAILWVVPGGIATYAVFMYSCAGLVAMGAADDARGLSPRARLIGHALVAALIVTFSPYPVRIDTLGHLLGLGSVQLGVMAVPFTAFVIVATLNAFNMLDGLDGLAGGVALATGTVLLLVGAHGLYPSMLPLVAVLVGASAAFLLFNAPTMWNRPVRTFMGDAGSTLIGVTLATVLVVACQGAQPLLAPINAVWLLFLPATEVIQSTVRRALAGRSPFAPDHGHLHHQLRAAGLSVRTIFFVVTATTLVGGCIGWGFERAHVAEVFSFATFVIAAATYCGVIRALVARARAHTLREEKESVLADGIGDIPHVQGVEGLDQRHYPTAHGHLSSLTNPNEPVRPRFVTPDFGPPDVESASDGDAA